MSETPCKGKLVCSLEILNFDSLRKCVYLLVQMTAVQLWAWDSEAESNATG